jgi:ubiquinone/menaquinone biosynthesis C-methylase UbiE
MNFDIICDYLKGRLPIQEIPIQWDAKAYTSEAFNKWAGSPAFKGWAGDKETGEEVEVIAKLLKAQPGDAILDAGCGYGRHALVLADRYGLKVTGIDISPGLITAARRFAGEKGLDITYEVRNATDLPWSKEFDQAMIAFNSFSLFSPEDAPLVLKGIHRALRPGGRLFLDLDNKPYNCRYGTRDTHWYMYPGDLVLQEIYFHGDISVEVGRDMDFRKGAEEVEEFIIFKRIYSLDEITALLTDRGFRVEQVYGGWDLSTLDEKSPKMILAGMKE